MVSPLDNILANLSLIGSIVYNVGPGTTCYLVVTWQIVSQMHINIWLQSGIVINLFTQNTDMQTGRNLEIT